MSGLPSTALCVTAVEAVTPLGFDAEQTCAAIRAGVNRFADHPFHVSRVNDPETEEGEPMVASLLTELDPDTEGRDRLLELALPAFKGLLAKAGFKRADLAKGGLLLSLPLPFGSPSAAKAPQASKGQAAPKAPNPSSAPDAGPDWVAALTDRLGLASLKLKKSCRLGHTGMASCILEASKLLASGEIEFCIVGGIESYHETETLDALDGDFRLKSARAVDGFIPGEGAVLLLLETAAKAAARKAKPLGVLSDFGFGKEIRNYASDRMSSGDGLRQAFQPALARPPKAGSPGRWVLCDLNGESYRASEWGVVRTRLGEKLEPIVDLAHPADCLGDTGAASTGMLIAYALHAFARGYAPAQEALIWNASDDGARSALVLTSAESH
jgi:3-oxoacyl-[acyl-carrier-protein] synthase I